MEGVLNDEADYLRRETRELWDKRCGDGVEAVALVAAEAARRDHFLEVCKYSLSRLVVVAHSLGPRRRPGCDELLGTAMCTVKGAQVANLAYRLGFLAEKTRIDLANFSH